MLRTVLFFFLAAGTWSGLSAQGWQPVLETSGPLVGKIEVMSGTVVTEEGSGFVISESGRVLTCAHVVADAQYDKGLSLRVTFPDSSGKSVTYGATIELISRDLDLAVLEVQGRFSSCFVLGGPDFPKLMDGVMVVGYPLGMGFKATTGIVQAVQNVPGLGWMLDLSASVDPGNSGGPVLGQDGKVVGIVAAKIEGHNFNLALPARNMIDFLAMADHPVSVPVVSTPPGARVFVNGNFVGTTPFQLQALTRTLELSVELDGYETLKRTLTLDDLGKPVEPQQFVLNGTADPESRVTLVSTPPGARIWVNNTDLGKTPVELEADKGTKLRIRLEAPGYKTLTQVVELTDEQKQTVKLEMSSGWF